MKERQLLAKQLLTSIFNYIENQKRIEGFAFDWLEQIIEISFLNDFNDLMEDALKLRNTNAKHGDPWIGIEANFKLDPNVKHYVLPTDKIDVGIKYSYKNVLDFLQNMEGSSFYTKNEVEAKMAIEKTKDDFELECIASSLLVNGAFDAAKKIIDNELAMFDYRVSVVKTVMCIELFRRDEIEKGKTLLKEIYPTKDDYWKKLFLARGLLGYEPWGGYPYSDY